MVERSEHFGKVMRSYESNLTDSSGVGSGTRSPSPSLSLRDSSFRLSDSERNSLSSNLKKQRSALVSADTTMADKVKTVSAVLKAIGKPVKGEKLTNLMEKRQ